jgi:hypothetical protein
VGQKVAGVAKAFVVSASVVHKWLDRFHAGAHRTGKVLIRAAQIRSTPKATATKTAVRQVAIGLEQPGKVTMSVHPRCLIPRFDGVILSQDWKEALW